MFQINQIIQFHYPSSTLIYDKAPTYEVRRVRVESVRDLIADPLTIEEYFNRPWVIRGRWIVRGFDIDKNVHRQFYLGNSLEHLIDSPLRLGIYEDNGTKPIELISREFISTPKDRILLARLLKNWIHEELDGVYLGVFATDLRVR